MEQKLDEIIRLLNILVDRNNVQVTINKDGIGLAKIVKRNSSSVANRWGIYDASKKAGA